MNHKLGFDYMEEAGGTPGGGPAAAPAPADATAPSAPPAADPPAVNWDEMVAPDSPVDDSLPDADDLPPDGDTTPAPLKAAAGDPPPQQPPQQPAAPAPQPPVEPPKQPEKTQEQVAAEAKAAREEMLTKWSGLYESELTEDVKNALMTAPETVMPRLMAQTAMDAVDFARREFQAALPALIAQHLGQTQQVGEVWKAFDAANPDLAKPEYRKIVAHAAKTVKATQPDLPADKAMAVVAATARVLAGLPAPGAQPPAQDTASQPVAPHNPVARGRASPRAPTPTAKKDAPNSSEIDWGDLAGAS